tara:strand:+ start:683 stop:1222 length:540 start_codon:yes stop_codon:yes gene_type:complete
MHHNDIPGLYRRGWHAPSCVYSNLAFFMAMSMPPSWNLPWMFTMWAVGTASTVFHATMDSTWRLVDNASCALFELICMGTMWGWDMSWTVASAPLLFLAQHAVSSGFEVDAVLVFSNLGSLWWHGHYDVLAIVIISFGFWYQNMLGSRPLAWCHAMFHIGMAVSGWMIWARHFPPMSPK